MTIRKPDAPGLSATRQLGSEGLPRKVAEDPLDAGNLVRLTRGLAVGFQDRIFGTEQAAKAAAWLADQMKAAGLEPAAGGSYFQTFTAQVGKRELIGRNVAGMIRGTDPRLAGEVVIVAGHFDSQQDTHQGANDNATGCAGVLAIAQALRDNPPKRTVLFVTYDGEEGLRLGGDYSPGRRGSRHYAAAPLFPIPKTAMMVNMDELAQVHLQSGRRDHIYQWASDDPFASRILKDAFAKAGGTNTAIDGYPEQPREAQFFTTDAEPLYRLGVPTINLLSGRYLENHGPEDTMKLVIPERMEAYARVAAQCVIEAANHPQSLAELGIQPGGLMPSFPLINERRSAGLKAPEEELFRLGDLHARLPELRAASRALLKELAAPARLAQLRDVGGVEPRGKLATEPNLHAIRERQKVLLAAYRDLPKGDVGARREAKKALDLLAGYEGILAASLYLLKIDTSSTYYMQRVPERLGDLARGARRLGLSEHLEGVVDGADTRRFKAEVNADRAVELARSALPGLCSALSRSAYALLDPEGAAKADRPVSGEDLAALEGAMTEAAYAALGKVVDQKGDLKRAALIGAFLDATLGRLKGSGEKWLERFADRNAMLDFREISRTLGLPEGEQRATDELAARIEASISFPADLFALKEALVPFYAKLTELAFGPDRAIGGLEALAELGKDGNIQKGMEAGARSVLYKVDREAIGAAADDRRVQALGALHGLFQSTLELRRLFAAAPEDKALVLSDAASLHDVKARLDDVSAALDRVGGGAATLRDELAFWTRWLTPFFAVEGAAGLEAKDRKEAAARGVALVDALWPKIAERLDPKLELDAGTLRSPIGTARALDAVLREAAKAEDSEQGLSPELRARKIRAQAALKKVRPLLEAREGLAHLGRSAAPGAVFQLHSGVAALTDLLGKDEVAKLAEVAKRLEALRARAEVELGRKERSGPMALLSVRAAQKRD